MLLENPKTGTLNIVYESAISEKTVPVFFFLRRNCMNYTLMERRIVKVLRHNPENGRKSHILYIQAILTCCSLAKLTRRRDPRFHFTRLSKMTSDVQRRLSFELGDIFV